MFFERKQPTRTTGQLGETLAVEYLTGRGYEILERNYRKRHGEVDIIAKFRRTLVFIEVKTRRTRTYGAPHEAVDERKQRQLSKIALDYLQDRGLVETPARFDVLGVILDQADRPVRIDHIENAFDSIG